MESIILGHYVAFSFPSDLSESFHISLHASSHDVLRLLRLDRQDSGAIKMIGEDMKQLSFCPYSCTSLVCGLSLLSLWVFLSGISSSRFSGFADLSAFGPWSCSQILPGV